LLGLGPVEENKSQDLGGGDLLGGLMDMGSGVTPGGGA